IRNHTSRCRFAPWGTALAVVLLTLAAAGTAAADDNEDALRPVLLCEEDPFARIETPVVEETGAIVFPRIEDEIELPAVLPATKIPMTGEVGDISFSPYFGLQVMPITFEFRSADGNWNTIDGFWRGVMGMHVLYRIWPDWQIGADMEYTFGGHTDLFGVGAALAWTFARAESWNRPGEEGTEHSLIASVLWQRLNIIRAGFDEFDESIGVKIGYIARVFISEIVSIDIGGGYRFAMFDYDGTVLSGDTGIDIHAIWMIFGFSVVF
ncbi:MAG: hypothetical protein ACYTAF_09290, partial [Planctomycetota bacterium]